MPISRRSSDPAARAEAAQGLALTAVRYLALDTDRLQRFMDLSGASPQSLRERLADAGFLAGVLDHLLGDEALLLDFAAWAGLPPESIAEARRFILPGAAEETG